MAPGAHPPVLVTPGDPAGIGGEIALRAATSMCVSSALPRARRALRAILSDARAILSHTHTSALRRRSSKPGLGAGPTPELRRLSVERAELESTKEGRKVYVKKSGLFFLSSKQEALDLNAAKQDAAVAAAAAAMDLADADLGEA